MSLAALITQATAMAFTAAGDLVASATWRQRAFGAYDPTTGTRATTNTDTAVGVIKAALSQDQAARAGVSNKAVRLFVKGADFGAVTPKVEDLVVYSGTTYTVKALAWKGTADVWEVIADV